MKKTYMQPRTKVVKIKAEQMICLSQVNVGTAYSGTTILDKDDDFDSSDDLW